MANRMAIESNHQDKLEKLAEQMESHQAQLDHSTTTLVKKEYDGLSWAIEMQSLQVSRAVEGMDNYSRDKPILGSSVPLEHQFHQSQFMATSSQTPALGECGVDYRYLNTLTIKHNYPIPMIKEPNG